MILVLDKHKEEVDSRLVFQVKGAVYGGRGGRAQVQRYCEEVSSISCLKICTCLIIVIYSSLIISCICIFQYIKTLRFSFENAFANNSGTVYCSDNFLCAKRTVKYVSYFFLYIL